jgi:hypothetical protein
MHICTAESRDSCKPISPMRGFREALQVFHGLLSDEDKAKYEDVLNLADIAFYEGLDLGKGKSLGMSITPNDDTLEELSMKICFLSRNLAHHYMELVGWLRARNQQTVLESREVRMGRPRSQQ